MLIVRKTRQVSRASTSAATRAALVGAGVAIVMTGLDASFTIGAWFTAAVLFLFALLAWQLRWGRPREEAALTTGAA